MYWCRAGHCDDYRKSLDDFIRLVDLSNAFELDVEKRKGSCHLAAFLLFGMLKIFLFLNFFCRIIKCINIYHVSFFYRHANRVYTTNAIVDANTLELLNHWDGIDYLQAAQATGPGGNEKTGCYV